MNTTCNHKNIPEGMSNTEKERAIQANRVYCKACEENGLKVCSWESFSGWQEYVEGKIGESQLVEKARDEIRQFTGTFGKYTVVSEEPSGSTEEDVSRGERARNATKIYKKACSDSGYAPCFFKNFGTWSDYVQGRMDEEEFYKRAKSEVEKMASDG